MNILEEMRIKEILTANYLHLVELFPEFDEKIIERMVYEEGFLIKLGNMAKEIPAKQEEEIPGSHAWT